jgi:SAM-dependent methyltransferase
MADSSYGVGLSNVWADERRRLALAEETFDAITFRHLNMIGVMEGMRCLEVGGGGGSVARFMAERVGPTGWVVVTDIDARLLDGCRQPNIEIRVHNICTDPLEDGFDIAHARMLLENVPGRLDVLHKLIEALRPGGWILVEDLDTSAYGRLAPSHQLFHPRRLGTVFGRGFRAVRHLAASGQVDQDFGRNLPLHLVNAGLDHVDAEVCSRLVRGGTPRAIYTALGARQVAGAVVATGRVSQADWEYLIETFEAPRSMALTTPMVSAWGQRVGA